MSRIFVSHSSENNAQALALAHWLAQEGWDDIFLDLDPERGLKAGERWEEELRDAADRCEAVIFLVSRAWLGSEWCRDEFRLARHLRKRLFGILIEDIPTGDLPTMLTREWQVVSVAPAGEVEDISPSLRPDRPVRWRLRSAKRDCAGSGLGFSPPASMRDFLPGPQPMIRTGHPIAACGRSKPTTPASSLAATGRSSRR